MWGNVFQENINIRDPGARIVSDVEAIAKRPA